MMVVLDIEDVFLPKPNNILVNLTEARALIEALLGHLNKMFQESHTVGSALGSAMNVGFKLIVSLSYYPIP